MRLAQRLPIADEPQPDTSMAELLDALPAAVLLVGEDGRVRHCNPAADELLALPLHGVLWRELIEQLFVPRPDLSDALQLHTGRLVTLSTRPLGNLRGQVLMLQDVTDAHQMRQRLHHQHRLADMGKMAASLAHQIRTPLATAMLYVSQLKAAQPDLERRERMVGKALTSLRGLERLINDMLLFVNSGQGTLERLEAAQLLSELHQESAAALAQKGIELHCAEDLPTLPVMVNRTLLRSALQNLLNNAEQALEGRDGARISLLASESEGMLRLCVCDNGPGIRAERQEAIFSPFVSDRPAGTGLGLAVVRAIIRSFGGEVTLHSQPQQGSCFCLCLPSPDVA